MTPFEEGRVKAAMMYKVPDGGGWPNRYQYNPYLAEIREIEKTLNPNCSDSPFRFNHDYKFAPNDLYHKARSLNEGFASGWRDLQRLFGVER